MILDTKTDVKSHQSELVVKAMEIMQKTYSDPDLNMASLADQLVKQVSEAVGYEDDHVFIRRFKKYTGKTPGQYRKESQ